MMDLKWMLIGFGIAMGIAIIGFTWRRYRQLNAWVSTQGKVVSQWRHHNRFAPIIEFQDSTGQTRQFKEQYIRRINQDWELQAPVAVRYKPQDSSQAVLDQPSPYFGIGVGGVIVCVVFIYTGLFLI
jgi:Protein of unknown function (DUF3592)